MEVLAKIMENVQIEDGEEIFSCDICNDRGCVGVGNNTVRICKCAVVKQTMKNIERSGLKPLMERYTLENFTTGEGWQKSVKDKATVFLSSTLTRGVHDYPWFAVFGQTGSGKTHICTAICGELLNRGTPVRYMLWTEEIKTLKATVNDGESHEKEMERLKTVKTLYIDDLFKCKKGSEPTDSDVRIAFEILNARYNARITTLISSEFSIDDICKIDGAIAGRINEMCGIFVSNISKNGARDYRWR